jgi:hypothetical protein
MQSRTPGIEDNTLNKSSHPHVIQNGREVSLSVLMKKVEPVRRERALSIFFPFLGSIYM